jgi:hypothetical protein
MNEERHVLESLAQQGCGGSGGAPAPIRTCLLLRRLEQGADVRSDLVYARGHGVFVLGGRE